MGNETETQTGFKLVGFKNFVRTNPKSDRFKIKRFHHVEFWCTDATNTARRFSWGLGMPIVAKSDLSTGNLKHASYLLRSGDLNLLFSAAYSPSISLSSPSSKASIPTFDATTCFSFSASHGLAVRAVAVEVDDVELAFTTSINNGAIPASPPVNLDNRGKLAEVRLYGDAILQEDVGTSESGLNSVALANNEETVLFPINEPVYGTKRKSQIETYLEHNEGAGVQHLALISEDIFKTLREMRKRSDVGGFEFMPSPPVTYYRNLKNRVGDVLSDEQIKECEELGILVDRDDQGTLLQIFTKPIGDRPTIFLEIIQRVGCMFKDEEGKEYQKGGCGGFGKGNFSELFKSVEEYEKSLEARRTA
ncbi:4-hydroxyphenylpyruvate dioxygenase [Trifolium repens]|nr:4-hydroxyphenylpyruvate dioxygenase [Trifolium repens]